MFPLTVMTLLFFWCWKLGIDKAPRFKVNACQIKPMTSRKPKDIISDSTSDLLFRFCCGRVYNNMEITNFAHFLRCGTHLIIRMNKPVLLPTGQWLGKSRLLINAGWNMHFTALCQFSRNPGAMLGTSCASSRHNQRLYTFLGLCQVIQQMSLRMLTGCYWLYVHLNRGFMEKCFKPNKFQHLLNLLNPLKHNFVQLSNKFHKVRILSSSLVEEEAKVLMFKWLAQRTSPF